MNKTALLSTTLFSVLFALSTHAQSATDAPVKVSVKQVEQRSVSRALPVSGRVHSRNDVSLSLTVSGELATVAEPGQKIQKGQVVAALDNKPILLRLKEMRIRANREKTNQKHLQQESARLQTLKATNAASQRLLDEAINNHLMSQADSAALNAQIHQLQDEQRRSHILASFDGIIAQRFLKAGEYLQAGANVVRVIDPNDLELRFDIPVAYANRIKIGDTINYGANGEAKLGQNSTISSILPAADPQSQTIEARATLKESNKLVSGQLLRVELSISGRNTLMVPRDAVILRQSGSFVYKINDGNKAERIAVILGEGEQEWVSVSGKLNAGDRVAIRGMERLENGQTVTTAGS